MTPDDFVTLTRVTDCKPVQIRKDAITSLTPCRPERVAYEGVDTCDAVVVRFGVHAVTVWVGWHNPDDPRPWSHLLDLFWLQVEDPG